MNQENKTKKEEKHLNVQKTIERIKQTTKGLLRQKLFKKFINLKFIIETNNRRKIKNK